MVLIIVQWELAPKRIYAMGYGLHFLAVCAGGGACYQIFGETKLLPRWSTAPVEAETAEIRPRTLESLLASKGELKSIRGDAGEKTLRPKWAEILLRKNALPTVLYYRPGKGIILITATRRNLLS
jgi:hypothetical protein